MISHKRARKVEEHILTQNEKDAIALENTKMVLQEKTNFHSNKTSWTPKPIHDENSIFSKKIPNNKVIPILSSANEKTNQTHQHFHEEQHLEYAWRLSSLCEKS